MKGVGYISSVQWTSERFARAPTSPARGRAFCTQALRRMLRGRAGAEAVIADAEIIVSELITNAINAGCRLAELKLSARHDCVHIEVHDDGAGMPELQNPGVADQHGRGLLIVSALATTWGVERSTEGKRVWAELALHAAR